MPKGYLCQISYCPLGQSRSLDQAQSQWGDGSTGGHEYSIAIPTATYHTSHSTLGTYLIPGYC